MGSRIQNENTTQTNKIIGGCKEKENQQCKQMNRHTNLGSFSVVALHALKEIRAA